MEDFKNALNLGEIAQIGFVVHDLSKSIYNYEQVLGIGPFERFSFQPEKSFIKDRKSDIELEIAIAQLTPAMSFELIQVIAGEPYHKDFLEEHGKGIQHLGFTTGEYDAVLQRAADHEIEVLMWAETSVPGMGNVRGAYLDTLELIGVMVEIIEIKPAN